MWQKLLVKFFCDKKTLTKNSQKNNFCRQNFFGNFFCEQKKMFVLFFMRIILWLKIIFDSKCVWWKHSKTEVRTKLKNSNCFKSKHKLWPNSKLELWENTKTQIVREKKSSKKIEVKIQNLNLWPEWINFWQNKFGKNNLTPRQLMRWKKEQRFAISQYFKKGSLLFCLDNTFTRRGSVPANRAGHYIY